MKLRLKILLKKPKSLIAYQSSQAPIPYITYWINWLICLLCDALNTNMKKFAVLFVLVALAGCKKTIENIQEDLVVKAMTDGRWKVTSFTLNGSPITADFSTYRFKYYSNKTVDAINGAIVEKTGTWDGNSSTMSTSANFTGAVYPLTLINGTWLITRNSWTYVEASQTVGSETKTMRLDKE